MVVMVLVLVLMGLLVGDIGYVCVVTRPCFVRRRI